MVDDKLGRVFAMATGNHILDALPSAVFQRISPCLRMQEMRLGDVLHESREPIEYVYFPVDCILSMVYELLEGDLGEQAVIGYEGCAGLSVFTGADSMPSMTSVQAQGRAYRMPASVVRAELASDTGGRDLLLRFLQCLFVQVAQTAVCNRHHSIEQRLCRWLLLCHDRVAGDVIGMTQQLMAGFLGVRRESVTMAARKLNSRNTITYYRGQITIVDRPGLEQCSCECYEVVTGEYARLLGAPSNR